MELSSWDAVFVQAPVGADDGALGGARLWLDLHVRRDPDRFGGIFRPAVGWDLSDKTSVFAGYAAVVNTASGTTRTEHRAWQQALWASAAGPVTVGLRPRLEQRFGAGAGATGLRGRMFGRAQASVVDPFGLVAWNETFVSLNDTAFGPAGFDQNRLFVGPAASGPAHRVEVGFLHLLFYREQSWTANGVIAVNLFVML